MAQPNITPASKASNTGRSVARIVRGMPTSDGAGVKLTRVLGTPELRRLDPFLMLDEFRSDEPQDYLAGFPDHPHRGFETFTYMLAGNFRHEDNHGGRGELGAGGGQWMTAGRGIVHSEMPQQEQGLVWGFQLWINLPAKDKMRDPGYQDVQATDIPTASLAKGVTVRVVAGKLGEHVGPAGKDRETDPHYFDVTIPAGADAEIPLPKGHAAFVYPFDGDVVAGDAGAERALARGTLGVLNEGERIRLATKADATKPSRVLVVAGKPIGEPVVQYGPFVMNTAQEIESAILDFQAGRF